MQAEEQPNVEKKFVKPTPKPGSNPVRTKFTMDPVTGQFGLISLNRDVVENYAVTLARHSYPVYTGLTNTVMEKEVWEFLIKRMNWLLMAKKLASSLSPEQSSVYGGDVSQIASQSVSAPANMVSFVDQFGYCKVKGLGFTVRGQPLHVFNYYARAVLHCEQNHHDARALNFYVNANWVNWRSDLRSLCTSWVNAWAASCPKMIVRMGNPAVEMSCDVPQIERGFAAFNAFVAGIDNKPPFIVNAIEIGIILENDQLFANNAFVQPLAARNVVILNWTVRETTAQMANYDDEVDAEISAFMGKMLNWVTVNPMAEMGSTGQLLHRLGDRTSEAFAQLDQKDLSIGWLLSGEPSVYIPPDSYYLNLETVIRDGLVTYVKSGLKF